MYTNTVIPRTTVPRTTQIGLRCWPELELWMPEPTREGKPSKDTQDPRLKKLMFQASEIFQSNFTLAQYRFSLAELEF